MLRRLLEKLDFARNQESSEAAIRAEFAFDRAKDIGVLDPIPNLEQKLAALDEFTASYVEQPQTYDLYLDTQEARLGRIREAGFTLHRDADGCDETFDVRNAQGETVASVPFWDDAAQAEATARSYGEYQAMQVEQTPDEPEIEPEL